MISLSPLKVICAPAKSSAGICFPPDWTETSFQVPWSSFWAFLMVCCLLSSATAPSPLAASSRAIPKSSRGCILMANLRKELVACSRPERRHHVHFLCPPPLIFGMGSLPRAVAVARETDHLLGSRKHDS